MPGVLPLAGIRVIDLGQIYQGPYATFLMAMAGADVIKVEPKAGERLRGPGTNEPPPLAFAMLNSNKRSVTLDLKTERGRALLLALARHGDVVLENYAPGVMDRLGVGAEVLRAANPRLIYASGTGYGLTGPDRDQLAMDHTVQAVSGMMSVTGTEETTPLRAGGAVADILGGVHLYAAVVTALLGRERTGAGAMVEVAMQESMFFSFCSNYTTYHRTGEVPGRNGNGPAGTRIAPYNVYETKDGYLAIICVTDAHWERLVEVMGREDLKGDPRFKDRTTRGANTAIVDDIVGRWAAGLTRAEAAARTRAHRIPTAPVRDLVEVLNDPHMHERGMLNRVTHPELGEVVLPASPLRFPELSSPAIVPSPRAGAHNEEVYGGLLGLEEDEIAALARDGVI